MVDRSGGVSGKSRYLRHPFIEGGDRTRSVQVIVCPVQGWDRNLENGG